MATTLANLRTDIRNRLVESTADYFTNAELLTWINYGIRNFSRKTEWLEKTKAYPMVANQYLYDLPSDILKVDSVYFEGKYRVWPRDREQFHTTVGHSPATPGPRPWLYEQFPWDTKLRIYPVPSSASASSTLSGGINDSVTSLTLADASSFPSTGRVTINSEQILYYAKSSNTLSQLVRGDGFTTAVSHSNGDTVKYAPLEVSFAYQPPDLSGDSDTTRFSTVYDEAIVEYCLAIAMQKKDKDDKAKMHFSAFDKFVKEASEERAKRTRDRLLSIKDEDAYYGYQG